MPEMIAFSPATWTCSFGNSAGSAPSRTVGAKPLKFNGTLHLRGERRARPESPRKSRGSVTHRQLRCNMTKCSQGMRVLPTAGPCASGQRRWYTGLPSSSSSSARRTPHVPRLAPHQATDTTARVMLVAVSLAWGVSWPALKIALNDIPPFSMRVGTSGLATVVLFALALLRRRNMTIHGSVAAVHLVVAGCLNIACFTLFSAFAQLATATSRVAVLVHDADLGGPVRLSHPRGAAEPGMRHLAPALRRRIDGACLSATRIERPDRPRPRARDGGELGGRYGLFEMGADRRRSDGNLGVATCRRSGGYLRRRAHLRRLAAFVARSCARPLGAGIFRPRRLRLRLSALVRHRPQVTGHDRRARPAECSSHWHRRLGAIPGRAADGCRHRRLRPDPDCRRRRPACTECALVRVRSDRTIICACAPPRSKAPHLAGAGLFEVGGARATNTAQCAGARRASPRQRPIIAPRLAQPSSRCRPGFSAAP